MQDTDNLGQSGQEQSAPDWVAELLVDEGQNPEVQDGGETRIEEDPEQSEASTTPEGTEDEAASDSETEVPTGLDGIPEEYRGLVEKAIAAKQRDLQAGYTKKFQALSEERTRIEQLNKFAQDQGLDLNGVMAAASAFQRLQGLEDLRILSGDRELYRAESAKAKEPEVDFDMMEPREVAAFYDKKLADLERKFEEKLQSQLKPIEQERTQIRAKSMRGELDALHAHLPPEVYASAQLKAKEYITKFGAPQYSTVEDIAEFLSPFIAQAQASLASASRKPTTSTSIPKKTVHTPTRSSNDLDAIMEENARKMGFANLDEMMRENRGK